MSNQQQAQPSEGPSTNIMARLQSVLGIIGVGKAPENDAALSAALNVLQQAAGQGSAEAQSCLGFMYFKGRGVPRDPSGYYVHRNGMV